MTSRERWTIYPLLMLTLGIVLKDKLSTDRQRLTVPQVVCQQLMVVDADGKPLVLAGGDAEGKRGILETVGPGGRPLVQLTAHDATGYILLTDGAATHVLGPAPRSRPIPPAQAHPGSQKPAAHPQGQAPPKKIGKPDKGPE